jgi:hypothetical protein
MMPVVHDGTTEMTQNKPENSPENSLECGIHDGKNNREEIGVKRKSEPQLFSLERKNHLLRRIAPHRSE